MARVLVIGHVNHDRLWRLDQPLRPGGRIGWTAREVCLGGGAFFTGAQLLSLGHAAVLVSTLCGDQLGRETRTRLAADGFDVTHVAEPDGETALTEILLEPSGERTILNARSALMRVVELSGEPIAEAAYINCLNPGRRAVARLETLPFVVSQFPVREDAAARPADLVIGSRDDFPGESLEFLWRRAASHCGGRLKHLVLTDGPGPITILDGRSVQTVVPARQVPTSNAIGAGDTYAAGLIAALLDGLPIEVAARAASETTAQWLEARERVDPAA
ncbi:PfkB family carbohydrate kinase [Mycoplana dimorpha]|uniref:Sugar/nucleoside kinase (Ribokinase family) n=1 Tax=Mycoplana dimorpha TaxID=28320 RepID=A0A2T5B3K9_MYCDI|nr:PfkB family carbohydrate kinase [Mycoplana dimorpha]PTM93552.1 sugar/nucleoside kinase (ribokinase family) [Mycoplana dimorpha]